MAKFPSDIINNHKAMCSVCGLLNQHTVKIKYPKNAETARIAGNCKYKKSIIICKECVTNINFILNKGINGND